MHSWLTICSRYDNKTGSVFSAAHTSFFLGLQAACPPFVGLHWLTVNSWANHHHFTRFNTWKLELNSLDPRAKTLKLTSFNKTATPLPCPLNLLNTLSDTIYPTVKPPHSISTFSVKASNSDNFPFPKHLLPLSSRYHLSPLHFSYPNSHVH